MTRKHDSEEWALVLGVSSGTGAAVSAALARDPGLNVFGVHRGNHPDGARAVADAVRGAGRQYHERIADAGKFEHVDPGVNELLEVVGRGRVRILVHSIANASVGYLVRGESLLHPKQVNKTFESMAHSFVYWSRALVQGELLAPEARLLALTNAVTESTLGNLSAIAAAKAALEMYVRYLAHELGPLGVRVNALKFGTVETTALQAIFEPQVWGRVKQLHDEMFPVGRMGTLDEVARFVSVLAGDSGSWFNGSVIDFTGAQMHSLYQLLMDRVLAEAGATAQS